MTCWLVTTLVLLPRFVQITLCSRYTTSTIPLRVEQFAPLSCSIPTTSKTEFANRISLDIIGKQLLQNVAVSYYRSLCKGLTFHRDF